MSNLSGTLDYAGFNLFSRFTLLQLKAADNVLLASVATATGCRPLTTVLIGAISVLEYNIGPGRMVYCRWIA